MKIKLCIFALSTALAGGCTLFAQPIAERVSKVVIKYCQEPYSQRAVYDQVINDELAPYNHKLHAHCSGDPAP